VDPVCGSQKVGASQNWLTPQTSFFLKAGIESNDP